MRPSRYRCSKCMKICAVEYSGANKTPLSQCCQALAKGEFQ